MALRHILFVEDEAPLRTAVAEQLADRGFHVEQAASGEEAVDRLSSFAFDIVITDLRLGAGPDGSAVLDEARALYPDIIGIIVTGYGTVKDAVEAIKRGATDFIQKPFQLEELLHVIDVALEQRRLRTENAYLRKQLEERYRFEGIIGKSAAMKELFALLETVAQTSSTILITGETGTGKELAAHAIHHNSPRRGQRFVAIHCGAIPETLLEAELFGHVRGAFTGAVATRAGRFEEANRGTLFLDEVGTMTPALQMKLLRVIQGREVQRLGDTGVIKVDVRIIAATNHDLAKMVAEGAFREDLYYRLAVIPVHMPPLRDRKDDVPLLTQHFLAKYGSALARDRDPGLPPPQVGIAQEALRHLMSHAWPGNVRELENAIERAVAFTGGHRPIEVRDLPPAIQAAGTSIAPLDMTIPEQGFDLPGYIDRLEREVIARALERTGGNKGAAAKLLNLKRTTLVEKLKRMGRAGAPRAS
ncbi:MAG TPA: sigma-54 dependent transcriptional regulator [Vicinamibacterales bacterium]|nr:sigma-54 dependent transcriptional regulator [Vicinamibacterales bacterium]HOQ59269.1 sigma-54 dependent transcriptional regulator [Vicinamibacterales bacterium]